jgi:hypothetical protein
LSVLDAVRRSAIHAVAAQVYGGLYVRFTKLWSRFHRTPVTVEQLSPLLVAADIPAALGVLQTSA